jgi:hypothetical protein
MSATDSFLQHWYFHIPNLILAALIYTLIGRYILALLFRNNPDAVILRTFQTVTNPVVNSVRAITPLAVPNGLILVLAVIWLMALRMFWYLTCVAAGMRPGVLN